MPCIPPASPDGVNADWEAADYKKEAIHITSRDTLDVRLAPGGRMGSHHRKGEMIQFLRMSASAEDLKKIPRNVSGDFSLYGWNKVVVV